MLPRVARISAEGVDRHERRFSDIFGAFGLLFVSSSTGAIAVVSITQNQRDVAVRFVPRRGAGA
jgi:hypothetical protein